MTYMCHHETFLCLVSKEGVLHPVTCDAVKSSAFVDNATEASDSFLIHVPLVSSAVLARVVAFMESCKNVPWTGIAKVLLLLLCIFLFFFFDSGDLSLFFFSFG